MPTQQGVTVSFSCQHQGARTTVFIISRAQYTIGISPCQLRFQTSARHFVWPGSNTAPCQMPRSASSSGPGLGVFQQTLAVGNLAAFTDVDRLHRTIPRGADDIVHLPRLNDE